jgi:hypothetical protein
MQEEEGRVLCEKTTRRGADLRMHARLNDVVQTHMKPADNKLRASHSSINRGIHTRQLHGVQIIIINNNN